MCYGCYIEYGKPTLRTPQVERVAELCKRLYEISAVGGNCHIVTDDWNIEDENVAFCLERVAEGGWQDERTGERHYNDPAELAIEKELLELMASMSEAERASALGLWEGFIT